METVEKVISEKIWNLFELEALNIKPEHIRKVKYNPKAKQIIIKVFGEDKEKEEVVSSESHGQLNYSIKEKWWTFNDDKTIIVSGERSLLKTKMEIDNNKKKNPANSFSIT